MNNEHDKTYKMFLKNKSSFLDLLQGFVKEEWTQAITEEQITAVEKSFILKDYTEKEADVIYQLTLDGEAYYFYILLELQSSVDYTMPYRLLSYMTGLWQELFNNADKNERESKGYKLPAIIPMVLYNGVSKWTANRNFKTMQTGQEKFGKHLVDFEYILFDVNRYTEEELLAANNLMSAVFMMDQDNQDIKSTLHKTVSVLQNITADQLIEYKNWLMVMVIPKMTGQNKEDIVRFMEQTDVKEANKMVMNIERNLDRWIKGVKDEVTAEVTKEVTAEVTKDVTEKVTIEMAKGMIEEGVTIEKIIKYTKLSREIVESLYATVVS